jgi:PIN domain nuclease of toxin-antitoxin system
VNRYLLDTHALIWFLEGDDQLSKKAKQIMENSENELFVSAVSLWEMAIKISIKKLNLTQPLDNIIENLTHESIHILPIDIPSILEIQNLPFYHKDPFDRLLIAQALLDNYVIISIETIFDDYNVKRAW